MVLKDQNTKVPSDQEPKVRLAVYVPASTYHALRIEGVNRRMSLSNLIVEALANRLVRINRETIK